MKKKVRASAREVRVSSRDHVRGSPMAIVTLVGYGDFSNPECTRTHRTVQRILENMGNRVRYVFRCFPEPVECEGSETAAEAAESASAQGQFWEMHDLLFESTGTSDGHHLAECATELGLDVRRFRQEMRDHVHLARIRAGRRVGVRHGVVRAPTFFINSRKHESSFGLTTLLPAIQAAAGALERT